MRNGQGTTHPGFIGGKGDVALLHPCQGATCTRCGAWRGELGSEPTPQMFVEHIVEVFRAVRRVLHDTGTTWVNLGDSYSGSGKGPTGHNGIGDQGQRQGFVDQRSDVPGLGPKQLLMMPARVALALQADGWTLRSDITWGKLAPMPESVRDRPSNATEHIFLLAKNPNYFYDAEAVRQPWSGSSSPTRGAERGAYASTSALVPDNMPHALGNGSSGDPTAGANLRNLWVLGPEPYPQAHFATFVSEIPRRAILAGTSARGQCPACGAPWRRTTDVTRTFESGSGRSGNLPVGKNGAHLQGGGATLDIRRGPVVHTQTTGWAPGCTCDAGDPVPQVCLDPFAGSGTTLAVARWHQRRAVGIELNPEYARLIEQRLAQGVLL